MKKLKNNLFDEIEEEDEYPIYSYIYAEEVMDKAKSIDEARLYIDEPNFDIDELQDIEEYSDEEDEDEGYRTWSMFDEEDEEEEC